MTMSLERLYNERVSADELTADAAQQAVLPLFQEILVALDTPSKPRGLIGGWFQKPADAPKGLYLWGGVGRGKSMLMDLFFDAATINAKRRVHFHAFMQEIHAGMHAARQTGVEDAIKPVADAVAERVRLLCFDEMQITDITDAMIVGRLFELLFAHRIIVVTTSNRVPDDLYKDGLNRALFLPFIAQIKERMHVHQIASPRDYRQDRLAQSDVYFHPAGAQAKAAIDALWVDLTGGDWESLTLHVQGREVVLPQFKNGIARVDFWHLCGQPLGPADYLQVAAAVKVLILEEIPLLSRANSNEAKRFVTLIDALYEAKVRLIASAAAIPEQLYQEGAGSFEFERTASRLREMQSDGWGK
ncbi:MAG: cell division protein ZapE [Pseudomonadota bacterium]